MIVCCIVCHRPLRTQTAGAIAGAHGRCLLRHGMAAYEAAVRVASIRHTWRGSVGRPYRPDGYHPSIEQRVALIRERRSA